MNYSDPSIEIISDGWKSLIDLLFKPEFGTEFDNSLVAIYFKNILEELIIYPHPDHFSVLWEIYNPNEKIPCEIFRILCQDEMKISWRRILKPLAKIIDIRHERLYQLVSQNAYRLPQKCDLENQKILQNFSNTLTLSLINKYHNPTHVDLEIKNFCKQRDLPYERFRTLDTIHAYCRGILPYPYRFREHPEYMAQLNNPSISNEIKQKIDDEIFNRDKRVKERFSSFRFCAHLLNSFPNYMDEKSRMEYELMFQRAHAELQTMQERTASNRWSKPHNQVAHFQPVTLAGNLFQCPFCYRFSLEELPRNAHNFPQHCDQSECKTAYKSWAKHVERAGYCSKNKI